MKKMLISGLLFLFCFSTYSQNLDLVVTSSGDSIACKIDSITESTIYLQIKTPGNVNWIQTSYNKTDIRLIKFDIIDPSKYAFKEGTSIIAEPLQPVYPKNFPDKMTLNNASNKELDFYLAKANKTKKIGKIMSISGPLALTAGAIMAAASINFMPLDEDFGTTDSGYEYGTALFLTGLGVTIVGLPILITGSSRIKSINKIKYSRGITLEFIPSGNYNYQAQNYQPGITLKIGF